MMTMTMGTVMARTAMATAMTARTKDGAMIGVAVGTMTGATTTGVAGSPSSGNAESEERSVVPDGFYAP